MAQDFKIADFFYPFEIIRLKRTFDRHCRMGADAIRAYQLERLKVVLNHAYERVPFYRKRWEAIGWHPEDFHRLEDLAALPLLTKADLRQYSVDLTAQDAGRHAPRFETTSGTTGTALSFLSDKHSRSLEFVYYLRHWEQSDYRLGDSVAEFSTMYFRKRPALGGRICAHDRLSNRLMLNNAVLTPEIIRTMIEALACFKPKFIKGMPSTLICVAERLCDDPRRGIGPKAVFVTGEFLSPAMRERIQKAFHAPCRDSYGHMERTVAASECAEGRMHLNPDYGFCEFLPSGGGRARLVGTSLHNRAMPLIRYDVGDEVERVDAGRACSCGLSFPVIGRVFGRAAEPLRLSGGKEIPNPFLIFEDVPTLLAGQIVQRGADDLLIRFATSGDETAVGRVLRARLGEWAGEGVRIIAEPTEIDRLISAGDQKFRPVAGPTILAERLRPNP